MSKFMESEKAHFSEAALCRALDVSRSGVQARRRRPVSKRAMANAALAPKIQRIAATHQGRYGSPRIHQTLKAEGERVGKNRVAALMRQEGIVARKKRRFIKTTDSRHNFGVADNIIQRDFVTTAPNQVWVGDVTYLHTQDGWLYLAVLIDLYSRRIVGWSAQATLSTQLTLAALNQAMTLRYAHTDLIHHTDRGSNYCATDYQEVIMQSGIRPSMSRKGDCWDNAVAESWFATLKTELGDTFDSRSDGIRRLTEYINYYNFRRIHSTIQFRTPVQFELDYEAQLAA
ncbi:MAG: IS3 family transposase [Pirellulaceae bacterium]|nr:IS3 family transposase [Pirellulaceae bacterium]